MKRLVVFLLLLACALCAAAQRPAGRARVTPAAITGNGQPAFATGPAATFATKADLGLFATGSGALASLLLVWSPLGAVARRRLGSRAQLSALILALLLCSIMAVDGCSGTSSAVSVTPADAQPAS